MLVCLKLLGTFLVGSCMILAVIVLADKALTPLPQTPTIAPADRRLAEENYRLSRRCAELDRENTILKLNVEGLMKVAVIPPVREDRGADNIPPQQMPVPVRVPTPEEVGVSLP